MNERALSYTIQLSAGYGSRWFAVLTDDQGRPVFEGDPKDSLMAAYESVRGPLMDRANAEAGKS